MGTQALELSSIFVYNNVLEKYSSYNQSRQLFVLQ